jgi:hypothetical protein
MQIGRRVHDVVVAALALGQQDKTIRADLGDLSVTSRVLWGFTHGIIQIAMTKGEPLAQVGISVPQLTQHAITLIREMLAGPEAKSS